MVIISQSGMSWQREKPYQHYHMMSPIFEIKFLLHLGSSIRNCIRSAISCSWPVSVSTVVRLLLSLVGVLVESSHGIIVPLICVSILQFEFQLFFRSFLTISVAFTWLVLARISI